MDIKDYLHLYLGCDVQYPDTDGKLMVAKFTGFSRADGIETTYKKKPKKGEAVGDYLSWKDNGYHKSNALNIKLILRQLSDMREEEGSEIMTMIWGIPDSCKYQLELKAHYIRLWQKHHVCETTIDLVSGDIDSYLGNELQTTTRQHEITKFLLSKGFDLFGLIDAGLAIDKTKL